MVRTIKERCSDALQRITRDHTIGHLLLCALGNRADIFARDNSSYNVVYKFKIILGNGF